MTRRFIPFSLIVMAGCGGTPNDSFVPEEGPPPISGGTLFVASGNLAIASDPDRSAIHVVDLGAERQLHRIQLGPTDEPGRIAEDQEGRVHVVLRRAGDVLSIDAQGGTILERRHVCAAARGIAVDPDSGELLVACAEGLLVRMPAEGAEGITRIRLESDLRDVVAFAGGRVLVSRFRSAEILSLQDDVLIGRQRPPDSDEMFLTGRVLAPTVAWNMRQISASRALLVHQQSQSTQLGVLGMPAAGAQYYGGDCSVGVVRPVVSYVDQDGQVVESAVVSAASLVVDAALVGDGAGGLGSVVAAAAADPGASGDPNTFSLPAAGVRVVDSYEFQSGAATSVGCTFSANDPFLANESAVGVAPLSGGRYVALYRDPAVLRIWAPAAPTREIQLDAGPAHDFGHALFHEAAGTGATCAGCHPEGGDDGRVWLFDTGSRRTQTMTGGILETAPFHWRGDVENSAAVMQGTFVGRMGGAPPREDEITAFERWVDAIPALPGQREETTAMDRGRAVFDSAACGTCHNGDRLTNNEIVNVGTGGDFNVPALYEVVYHTPYLHDGSALTLEQVVTRHGGGDALSDTDRADLITYLRSL